MITRHRIAPNGPEFSRLAYGTWRILDEEDKANCAPQSSAKRTGGRGGQSSTASARH
jgi:hypothetical protein